MALNYDQKKMIQTRAELLGVKPKVLAARIKRRLKTIRSQIEGIGAGFEDIDMNVFYEGEELLSHLDEYEKTIDNAVKNLEEVPEW